MFVPLDTFSNQSFNIWLPVLAAAQPWEPKLLFSSPPPVFYPKIASFAVNALTVLRISITQNKDKLVLT